VFGQIKAKFHYASWFGAGSKLVRSWFEPDSVMEFGFEPVCDQLRTGFEAASVMEFGFKLASLAVVVRDAFHDGACRYDIPAPLSLCRKICENQLEAGGLQF